MLTFNHCWLYLQATKVAALLCKHFLSSVALLSDLTMVTTSGKSKARCSAVNVAHPSAGTPQRQWRPCRRTAHPRTSSSPARRLTPALPTVLPVPPKKTTTKNNKKQKQTLHTLSLASCTDGHTGTPVHILFKLSLVNLYCISTLDWNHGPLTFVENLKTRCTITSWTNLLLYYSAVCNVNSRGWCHHAQ